MPKKDRKRCAIIVLGMHRSGTSALTGVLGLLGARLPAQLMAASPDNPKGFFEPVHIVAIHDRMLASAGTTWWGWEEISEAWLHSAPSQGFVDKLVAAVSEDYAAAPLFVVKDPRMCRLMPLWYRVLERIDVKPCFAISLRNPVEVARSLQNRDGLPLAHGCLLWLRHVLDAEHYTRGHPRVFVRYPDLLAEPRAAIDRMRAGLGIAWPRPVESSLGEIEDFLDPSLRTQIAQERDIDDMGDFSPWLRQAYESHEALVHSPNDKAAKRRLDSLRAAFAASDAAFTPLFKKQAEQHATELAVLHETLAARQTELAALGEALAERDTRLTALDRALAERDTRLAALDQAMAERDRELGGLRDALVELKAKVAALDQAMTERDRELGGLRDTLASRDANVAVLQSTVSALRASTSWRITAPLRSARRLLGRMRYSAAGYSLALGWRMLRTCSLAPLREWRAVRMITRSGLFDREWYLRNNLDVAAIGINPVRHYIAFGAREGRDPSLSFSTRDYARHNPDVAAAGANPLVHFFLHGAREGRTGGTAAIPAFFQRQSAMHLRIRRMARCVVFWDHFSIDTRHRIRCIVQNRFPPSIFRYLFSSVESYANDFASLIKADKPSAIVTWKQFAFISGCAGDSFRYRCEHHAETLRNIGYGVDVFEPNYFPYERLLRSYCIVVAHRVPWDSEFDRFILSAKSKGILVVYDVDDLVFDVRHLDQIDAYNRLNASDQKLYRDGVERYNRSMGLCDAVTVSTEKLFEEVRTRHPNMPVVVMRNKVSQSMCQLANNALAHEKPAGKLVTLAYFSGTPTHQGDFAVCAEALYRILKDSPNVRLMIVGHLELPGCFGEFGSRVEIVPFMRWQQLADVYRRVDINLAPLEYRNAFTEAKSELKFLEAALLSVPTIASDLGAYRVSVDNWKTGVLCANTEEWFLALKKLILNEELRREIGRNAAAKVAASGTTHVYGADAQSNWRRLLALQSAQATNRIIDRKPSIAFVTRAPIATTGGGYKKIFILANFLKRRGYDVRVYVEAIAHLENKTESEIANFCRDHFDFDPKFVVVGHSQISPADVAIATNWPTAPTVDKLDQARVKLYFVQDFEPDFYSKDQAEYDLANATYDLGLSAITIGDYLKGKLQQRGRLTRSIPFAVDETFHAAGRRRRFQTGTSGCSVLFFARPDIPRRNFSVGIEALAALSRALPGVEIKLYGLENRIELPFSYKHLGQLTQAQLAAEMAKSDIHLSYSLTNVSTVIYEAMACGCACVEADVESVRGMVESGVNCLLAEPNAAATYRALIDLVQDSELRLRIAREGLALAKEMTEAHMCEEFMRHVLESALAK